ncbi:MAG: hypothetical protein CMM56_02205 [Rhodospirillaceae bacterium]|nr:hypothetical protein [Rhodospirillaceae bacterium]|tara:strand:- start:19155 stop:20273 length:1119 start_codon:yes stop_codon:yes gene_type:complete
MLVLLLACISVDYHPSQPVSFQPMPSNVQPSNKVLAALGLDKVKLTPFESGLINNSWHVEKPNKETLVLQRVNPIFPPTINDDINTLTQHLEKKKIPTPLLLPTPSGKLWLEDNNYVWRMLTFIPGITRDVLETPYQAEEAGALLANFHLGVSDLRIKFTNPRLGVHNTREHLEKLKKTLAKYKDHVHYKDVKILGERILKFASTLPKLPNSLDQIVHGDPKISNVIFDKETDQAICLVDLDTISTMPIILELGDAIRSWCNVKGEDSLDSFLSLPFFQAAINGYSKKAGHLLTKQEWDAIPAAVLTITIELAARFTTDALVENYFGWNSELYATSSEHNQIRAQSQICLAKSILSQWNSIGDAICSKETST